MRQTLLNENKALQLIQEEGLIVYKIQFVLYLINSNNLLPMYLLSQEIH